MDMKKSIIVYHSADFDGVCSKLIALRAFPESETFGYNYGDSIPNLESYDKIIMIDISFPGDLMLKLKDRLIWIDHHITAIQDSMKYKYDGVPGIRKVGEGACELAWKYLIKTPVPQSVKYLSAYDVFNKTRFPWIEEVVPYQYSLRGRYGLNLPDEILEQDPKTLLDEGKSILRFLELDWKEGVNKSSFPITIDGKYKGICLITTQKGSLQFESVFQDYDLFVWGTFDKNGIFRFSMASNENRIPEFNCGAYLKDHYNGGGHQGIGGGVLSLEQFLGLIQQKIL
jgi:oligoribonuclease NrnB/cAMP/cGMP phosphodiesterase (DHH superfamily)